MPAIMRNLTPTALRSLNHVQPLVGRPMSTVLVVDGKQLPWLVELIFRNQDQQDLQDEDTKEFNLLM